MKLLIVCSYNNGRISPFVKEQVNSLKKLGVSIKYFKVRGKGALGYLKNLPRLINETRSIKYDLIHAHYGYCGILALLQIKIPVICTFHGSDVHNLNERLLSLVISRFTKHNILTNKKQIQKLALKKRYSVIKCGIDLNIFKPLDKRWCKEKFGLSDKKRHILFSSSFSNQVKNASLAKRAIGKLKSHDINFIELRDYSRKEVAELLNAVDLLLVTSNNETGPLILKEALACNTPVVSTNVGDALELLSECKNGFISNPTPDEIADKIIEILEWSERKHSRQVVEKYSLENVAKRLNSLYNTLIKQN